MRKKIVSSKIFFYVLIILFSMFLIDYFITGYDVINERYGINVLNFAYIFIASEIVFNLGIFLMLKGSGLLRIKIRDLLKFHIKNVNLNNPLSYWGFLMNRAAAVIPWLYVLLLGYDKLPWPVISAIMIELVIVIYLGFKVQKISSMGNNRLEIRKADLADVDDILFVEKQAWPKEGAATKEIMESRINTFPDGIFVAVLENKIIGVVVFQKVNYEEFLSIHNWYEATDNGYIKKSHRKDGDSIFGVDLSVVPDAPYGVGAKLLRQVGAVAIKNNLKYGILGGRIPYYHKYSNKYSAEEYLNAKDERGDLLDPEVRFYKKNRLRIVLLLPDYFKDPESMNYGVLLRWKNPFYSKNKIIQKISNKYLFKLVNYL
ncbi:MAG: hypothetical protein WCT33_05925 [Patescibacteria group bacterium]